MNECECVRDLLYRYWKKTRTHGHAYAYGSEKIKGWIIMMMTSLSDILFSLSSLLLYLIQSCFCTHRHLFCNSNQLCDEYGRKGQMMGLGMSWGSDINQSQSFWRRQVNGAGREGGITPFFPPLETIVHSRWWWIWCIFPSICNSWPLNILG